jgi:hypothetical protein
MGQRTIGAKNPFPARKIQYKQLNITLTENMLSNILCIPICLTVGTTFRLYTQ